MAKAKKVTDEKAFWWWEKNKKFTLEEVAELLERVKLFNAGCIDKYLSKHVDKTFVAWLDEKGVKPK